MRTARWLRRDTAEMHCQSDGWHLSHSSIRYSPARRTFGALAFSCGKSLHLVNGQFSLNLYIKNKNYKTIYYHWRLLLFFEGSTPYPDMAAREVMRNVQNGYRLERPSHCHTELFRVISRCWHADPNRRPEFQTLRRDLAQLLEDNMNGHYVDLESFASECNDWYKLPEEDDSWATAGWEPAHFFFCQRSSRVIKLRLLTFFFKQMCFCSRDVGLVAHEKSSSGSLTLRLNVIFFFFFAKRL